MTKKYLFKLYLSGRTPNSNMQIANLKKILEDNIKDKYSLEIIFISENPELAGQDDIICTPTLIKQLPSPPKRVVGNFTDKEKILVALDL